MKDKVYEMYDDYYKAKAQLQELIDARNQLKESLKTAHPSRFAEGWIMLNDANQKIEKCRAALKGEYDAHQETCRGKEKYEQYKAELQEGTDGAFIYFKHCRPESYERVKNELYKDMTPEEIEEFNARIAHLEATRLEEFIAEKIDVD